MEAPRDSKERPRQAPGIPTVFLGILGYSLILLSTLRYYSVFSGILFPVFSGTRSSGSWLFWASGVLSRKKPATIRQQPTASATKRRQPAAILRGRCREAGRSGRAAFRQHAKPYSDSFQSTETTGASEIHGVESLKRGDEIKLSDFDSTLKRNACFWHKWPSGLTAGGGTPRLAGVVGSNMAA